MVEVKDRAAASAIDERTVRIIVQTIAILVLIAGLASVHSLVSGTFWLNHRLFPELPPVLLPPRLAIVASGICLLLICRKLWPLSALCFALSVAVILLGLTQESLQTAFLSLCMVLTGLALCLANTRLRPAIIASQIIAMIIGLVTVSSIVSYGYGICFLFKSGITSQIPVFYALCYGAAGFALFFLHPQYGPPSVFMAADAGGMMARCSLIPLWLAVPIFGLLTGMKSRGQEGMAVSLIALNAIVPCAILTIAHILHRKEREKQMAFDNVLSVNQMLNQQFIELLQSSEQTRSAIQARSQFLANLNHELRTPLTGLQGGLDLALTGPLTEEQRELLHMARDSAQSLLHVIEDILDFRAMQAKKLNLVYAQFELRPLIESLSSVMEKQAKSRGLSLNCSVAANVPEILEADAGRLRQVLTNLLDNALKFTDRGGASLEVVCLDKGDGSFVKFVVSDSGIGIPSDKHEEVFEPFALVDGSTTRKYGGTGLGLSIVHVLVKLMGGELGLSSEPGRGSQFWFTLPVAGSPGVTFKQVVSAHTEWKATFLKAIASGSPLDAAGMGRDDLCNVGLWLYGEGKTRFGEQESFHRLLAAHARFHQEAARICAVANDGSYDEACRMLKGSTPYARASETFTEAFTAFRLEAQNNFKLINFRVDSPQGNTGIHLS